MPRSGGESEKLGGFYEYAWTVDRLLDLLSGEALSLTIEPFGKDAIGIEFIKELPNGSTQFHSAKRQTTGSAWTLSKLTELKPSGESILSPLFGKLAQDANATVVFVSGTTPNELNEICERASRSQNTVAFSRQLDDSPALKKSFFKYLLPLTQADLALAHNVLSRFQVVGITEREVVGRVDQRLRWSVLPTGRRGNKSRRAPRSYR